MILKLEGCHRAETLQQITETEYAAVQLHAIAKPLGFQTSTGFRTKRREEESD